MGLALLLGDSAQRGPAEADLSLPDPELVALVLVVVSTHNLPHLNQLDALDLAGQRAILSMDSDLTSQVLATNHTQALSHVPMQRQVVKLAIAQVDQGPSGEHVLDRIHGALGLLQVIPEGQHFDTCRRQQTLRVVQLGDRRAERFPFG